MTKPSLGSLSNFNSSANTVTAEEFNSDANLFFISLPLANPEDTSGVIPLSENLPFMPKRKIAVITGIFSGSESAIKDFIDEIEAVVLSPTQSNTTYTNSVTKQYPCKLNNFTYRLTNEGNTICRYTLELFHEAA